MARNSSVRSKASLSLIKKGMRDDAVAHVMLLRLHQRSRSARGSARLRHLPVGPMRHVRKASRSHPVESRSQVSPPGSSGGQCPSVQAAKVGRMLTTRNPTVTRPILPIATYVICPSGLTAFVQPTQHNPCS
jgi:hypothetical protein